MSFPGRLEHTCAHARTQILTHKYTCVCTCRLSCWLTVIINLGNISHVWPHAAIKSCTPCDLTPWSLVYHCHGNNQLLHTPPPPPPPLPPLKCDLSGTIWVHTRGLSNHEPISLSTIEPIRQMNQLHQRPLIISITSLARPCASVQLPVYLCLLITEHASPCFNK